jgi:hypothetical protein
VERQRLNGHGWTASGPAGVGTQLVTLNVVAEDGVGGASAQGARRYADWTRRRENASSFAVTPGGPDAQVPTP